MSPGVTSKLKSHTRIVWKRSVVQRRLDDFGSRLTLRMAREVVCLEGEVTESRRFDFTGKKREEILSNATSCYRLSVDRNITYCVCTQLFAQTINWSVVKLIFLLTLIAPKWKLIICCKKSGRFGKKCFSRFSWSLRIQGNPPLLRHIDVSICVSFSISFRSLTLALKTRKSRSTRVKISGLCNLYHSRMPVHNIWHYFSCG